MADDGGLSRFQARMAAIPEAVRAAVQPALLKSAEEIAKGMRQLAAASKDTGDLIDSIEVTTAGNSTPPFSQPGGSKVVAENAVAITVGNEGVRYPHLVEYGTTKSAAQPFFWPGFRLYKKKAENRIKTAIRRAIKQNRTGQ